MGMGAWRPAGAALKRIRSALVERPDEWMAATRNPEFTESLELSGDSLIRGPRGFDRDHPLAEDLKRKDFIAIRSVPQSFFTSKDLVEETLTLADRGRPLMAFLCEALEVPF